MIIAHASLPAKVIEELSTAYFRRLYILLISSISSLANNCINFDDSFEISTFSGTLDNESRTRRRLNSGLISRSMLIRFVPSKCTNLCQVSTDAIVHLQPWVLWPICAVYEARLRESIQVLAEVACEILRIKLADDKSSIQKPIQLLEWPCVLTMNEIKIRIHLHSTVL